jgi:hypothetical protein
VLCLRHFGKENLRNEIDVAQFWIAQERERESKGEKERER